MRIAPAIYATLAAIAPIASVSSPDRHQDAVDHFDFSEPMPKKITQVITQALAKACSPSPAI